MKRPMFLTIWLVLMTLSAVWSIYSYTLGSENITKMLPNLPSWALIVFVLLGVVNLFAVIMLWMWKKMGFYISIGSAIIVSSLSGMILGGLGIAASIMAILGVVTLYFAMKPVWQNFK